MENLNNEFITLTIGKQKNIALIAHDGKKKELIQWCLDNKASGNSSAGHTSTSLQQKKSFLL